MEEEELVAVALVEAGALLTMTVPGAKVTALGEVQEWEVVVMEEGAWEWEGWVIWVTWEGWEWVVGEVGGQAHGAVEEEVP